MTLEEIEAIPDEYLLPKHIAPVLGMSQYTINVQAQDEPDALGFPVVVTGSRVRIPKEAFLFFMRYGKISVEPPAAWMERLKTECMEALKKESVNSIKQEAST